MTAATPSPGNGPGLSEIRRKVLLEPSPFTADAGELIGRDPMAIPASDWEAAKVPLLVGLKAVRAKCLDCAHSETEVRKCVSVTCPLWHLRLGKVSKGLRALHSNETATPEE